MPQRAHKLFPTAVAVAFTLSGASADDLTKHYAATLEYSDAPRGYAWTCGPEDVWALRSFSYALGDKFRVSAGPCTVVFGTHERNPLWAVVFAREESSVQHGPDAKAAPFRHIWLRLNPARVGELFPGESVIGHGDAALVRQAQRVAHWKVNGSYQAGGQPAVPKMTHLIFDVDMRDGVRNFYGVDEETSSVNFEDAFARRALPESPAVDADTAAKTFDAVWQAFDEEYAMFTIKPGVDWPELRGKHRPAALAARNEYDLAAAIAGMLAALEDLHVYVMAGPEYVPGFTRERPLNANWNALASRFGKLNQPSRDLAWGRSEGGIGYVNVLRLADPKLPDDFDAALEKLADCDGLIIDLRFNGGGDETLAQKIAARFVDQPRVYSTNRYRNGPGHDDLGPVLERSIAPRGDKPFGRPVIALQGRRTMSSAESFALMLAQCPRVTTMGDHTAGSSANPRRLSPGGSITVNLPRWLDMTPEGKPIDAVGVAPDVRVEAPEGAFTGDGDPVLDRALAGLRAGE